MPKKGNEISVLVAKNLKLAVLMFKMMEHCTVPSDIHHVTGRKVLEYQHQWELEQKKTDELNMTKVDQSNWAKIMEAIVLHLKLVRWVSVRISLAP